MCDQVKRKAAQIYIEYIKTTSRNTNRRSLICACLYYAFFDIKGYAILPIVLTKILKYNKKCISSGINTLLNKGYKPKYRIKYIHYIQYIMKDLECDFDIETFESTYELSQEKSEILRKAMPQTISLTLCYNFLKNNNSEIPKDFYEKYGVKETVLTKLSKELITN